MPNPARPEASVVIPAHNEGTVIARCLQSIIDQEIDDLEVVVVANGCADDTADVARQFADRLPGLRVVEIERASKIAALNTGDDVATAFPRVYLDGDIELDRGSLQPLVDALTTDRALAAAPAVRIDTAGAAFVPKAFFTVFSRLPYARRGLVGLGVYAMSEAGRKRFDRFPDIMADDLFVHQMFSIDERQTTPGEFVVRVPRSTRDLVRVRTRGRRSVRELQDLGISPHPLDAAEDSTARALVGLVVRRPWLLPHALVYVGVMLVARRQTSHAPGTWLRDHSTRSERSGTSASVAYLVTHYPKLSHTFIEREILGLRELGVDVHSYSVHPFDERELLSETMRTEAAATTVLVPSRSAALASAGHFALHHPKDIATLMITALNTGERGLRSRLWQVFYALEAVVLVSVLRPAGIRHVHVHLANNAADVARTAVRLGQLLDGDDAGWGWSMTMHGPNEFEAVERYDLAAKVASAAAVACISDFTKSQLMRLVEPDQWDKLSIVRMSVDVARYRPDTHVESPEGVLRVLFVGRLVPEKGPFVLLDAVESLLGRDVKVELRVVGDGPLALPMADAIRRRGLQDAVTMVGPVGQDDLPDEFGRADVFCLPSFQEGLPVVLMEALASGVPAVTSRINGIPELVEDGVTGCLVTPGRADLLAAAIESLAHDADLRASMVRAGRDKVEAEYATDVTAQSQLEFLAEAQRRSR